MNSPWCVDRWVVTFNRRAYLLPSREAAYLFLVRRWNTQYAEEGDREFPIIDATENRVEMDTLIGWFLAQFDAVQVELQHFELEVEEVMALAADEAAFQAWRSTGRAVDDLEAEGCELGVPEDDPQSGVPQPGVLYDCGFVEGPQPDGSYLVTVGNSGYQDTRLEKVERYLWDAHARSEGHYAAGAK